MKGLNYRYLLFVQGKFGTKKIGGKKKRFLSKEKAERYCDHLDRNNKQYQLWDMNADID